MNREEKISSLCGKEKYGFADLLTVMELLRSPGGCPWDMEQDHKSIREDLIEETYEVIEAIDTENPTLLCEELGDVMLQTVLHSSISKANGGFDVDDVITGVCKKLIIRHPHVFGDVSVSSTGEVLDNWEQIKQATKGANTATESINNISSALPALVRADKIGKKAAKHNFDFASAQDALEKTKEEVE